MRYIRPMVVVAALTVSVGCTTNITTPPQSGGGGGGQVPAQTAQTAYANAQADVDVKQINLQVYRAEFNQQINNWVFYYYAPEQDKSYKAMPTNNGDVKLVVVTEQDKTHKPSYNIDRDKWKVDSEQAKQITINNINQTTNVNVNVQNINNITLISAAECQQQTGKVVNAPVWVTVVNNIKIYINANTGQVIHKEETAGGGGGAAPTPTPTAAPTAQPTAMPTAMPTAQPTATPTAQPTAMPTAQPTAMPTAIPTMMPTANPGGGGGGGASPAPEACGQFRTFTQGGYGAPPNGNNPGMFLHQNYQALTGGTLVVGIGNTITFTSAQAITDFLPSGGQPGTLTASLTDPTDSTSAGVFASQVAALELNLAANPGLANVEIVSGAYADLTVGGLLTLAEQVLGGDMGALPVGESASSLNDAVTRVNEFFNNGASPDGTTYACP